MRGAWPKPHAAGKASAAEMQEILDDTHDQEDHGESQTSNSQHTQEGQAGISYVEHGDKIVDGIRDPAADGIENVQDGLQNSSSLQKHSFSNLTALKFISTGDQAVVDMDAADGIEPPFPGAKPGVRPLDEAAI